MQLKACLDETRLMRLMAGELGEGERDAVEDHVAACDGCRRVIAALARLPDTEPSSPDGAPEQRGTAVGRYLLLGPIGSGAMGRVYAAHDAELDRKVAIKLLRPLGRLSVEAERAAVMREARAMAKITHPHVVAVHDVGTFGDSLFIAMELVEGRTLRHWLRERPQGWRQVVNAFIAAADALSAAHDAGVVHRDFKPDNVLVDRTGRVRVTDFGLAQILEPGSSAPLDAPDALRSTAAGTPAYMAPEVMAGAAADAHSDQFSFCVALYEALSGQRPFSGASVEVFSGARSIPARVLRILRRGLQHDPAARHPSMAAIAVALRRASRPLPRLPLALASGLLALGLWLGARHLADTHLVNECVGRGELEGAWGPERRTAVRGAFVATRRPFAEFALSRTLDALDGWAAEWHQTRRAACEGALELGEASREALPGALHCLAQRRSELAALTKVMAAADGAVVERATSATYMLPRPSRCLQRSVAIAPRPDASSEATRAQALDLLAEANGLLYAGRYPDGIPLANRAADLAQRSGDVRVETAALTSLAELQQRAGAYAEAQASFERAVDLGLSSGLDAVSVEAWVRLVFVVGVHQAHRDDGERIAKRAEAAIRGIGGSPRLEARLATARAGMFQDSGRYPEAFEQAQRALELNVAALGADHPDSIIARVNAGSTVLALNRHEEALAYAQEAHQLTLTVFGPSHPRVATTLTVIAGVHEAQGDYAHAAELYGRALELGEKALGPDHPQLHSLLINHCFIAGTRLGAFDPALSECRRSLALAERTTGPESHRAAQSHFMVGRVLLAKGEAAQAHPELVRARQIYDRLNPDGHAVLSELLVDEAAALEALGQSAQARALLDRAAPMAEKFGNRFTLGNAHLALARLAWSHDKRRASELALVARSDFQASGRGAAAELAQVDAWLATHRP